MKRAAAIILSLVLVFTFSACKDKESSKEYLNRLLPTAKPAVSENDTTADTAAHDTSEPTPGNGDKTEEVHDFAEITIVDNEYCSFKITGIDPDNMWGYTLKAYLENKSSDKTYMFSVINATINGVQSDPIFGSSVAPGKKANEDITFSDTTLDKIDIGAVTDIQLYVRVYDNVDWMADNIAEETIHIYPLGEENATIFVRESQPDDVMLIDIDEASVILTGYDPDNLWGYAVDLYLVNKTDKHLMFSADNVSVNGFMMEPYFAKLVSPGAIAFSSMSWSESSFVDNGITSVDEIEMLFSIYDSDDWLSDNLIDQKLTLNP